ncbi:MAG: cytochrome c [Gemmatimonadota bacterium]|nr:cytochrome c [Gemmatimonadota bacterium]
MFRRALTPLSLAAVGLLALSACRPGAVRRPAPVTAANVALGDSLFNTGNCQRCHGKGGIGAQNAPALDGKKWLQLTTGSYEEIVKIITEGVPQTAIKDASHRFAMRGRGGNMNLTDPQVQAVAAYVWTLSHK